MPKPPEDSLASVGRRTLSPPDSSLDDLELENCIAELDNLSDLDGDGLNRKPHFLDYDNKPPADLVEQHHKWNGVVAECELTEPTNDAVDNAATYNHVTVGTVPFIKGPYDLPPPATASTVTTTLKMEKRPGTAVGSRGTWPMKERPVSGTRRQQHHSLHRDLGEVGPKMECVYSLLSMLGSTNVLEMSSKFLELSRNQEKCAALRRSGCVPLLVHIIHNEPVEVARRNARHALVNVVRCNVEEAAARRELKVLRLIDQLIDYTDLLREQSPPEGGDEQEQMPDAPAAPDSERHPIQAIGTLAKISYDEEHRHAMCQLGALQTIASLVQMDHRTHGTAPDAIKCIEMRRYASMVLTNLTFGQGNNKALLCANRDFMRALVAQLGCAELIQVTASVLRNLSWRADAVTKQMLVEIGTVVVLTEAAMRCGVENTLKSILSALWNLSNHCAQNRAKICAVPGALEFLIDLLTYEAPSRTMSIVENAGGILRNISSHIAQCEPYRRVLRDRNCLRILLDQLKSPSLTVVGNACGTLGNLSSDNVIDQRFLREHGAIPMLRSLIYSKHSIISNGSRLTLRNLQNRPVAVVEHTATVNGNGSVTAGPPKSTDGKDLPGLNVRKQRALEQELGCAFYRDKDTDVNGTDGKVTEDELGDDLVEDPDDPDEETPINYGLRQSSYDYQETDIDQLTDYSLRYAENQSDSDDDREDEPVHALMPEDDSVKCYYTEGTPQIISSATSMSDLRAPFKPGASSAKSNPIPIGRPNALLGGDDPGCGTPDKPYNYCEEGTPDFSRDESLDIIEQHRGEPEGLKAPPCDSLPAPDATESVPGPTAKSVSFVNTADETPLMFSRTSSMGSLSSAEPACTDDKSSIVSEFSRMASGVLSPSELPDSPTQTIDLSPRSQSAGANERGQGKADRSDSAFADSMSKFNVEHTPAQFSCATSLSNLSLEEKEMTAGDVVGCAMEDPVPRSGELSPVLPNPAELLEVNAGGGVPDGREASDVSDVSDEGEDDELLASCISIGMSSVVARSAAKKVPPPKEIPGRGYYREDANDSDDSSNLSDNNDRLLEECILSGMPKPKHPVEGGGHKMLMNQLPRYDSVVQEHPFRMMRNPVHLAPLFASDEISPFHVEDSPCNFSTVSNLSELTVATDMATFHKPRYRMDSQADSGVPAVSGVISETMSSPAEGNEGDFNLVDEAIAVGISGMSLAAADDSAESLPDSNSENSQALKDCIENGMPKPRKAKNNEREVQTRQQSLHGARPVSPHASNSTGPKNEFTTLVMSEDVGASITSAGVGSEPNQARPTAGRAPAQVRPMAAECQRPCNSIPKPTDNPKSGQRLHTAGCIEDARRHYKHATPLQEASQGNSNLSTTQPSGSDLSSTSGSDVSGYWTADSVNMDKYETDDVCRQTIISSNSARVGKGLLPVLPVVPEHASSTPLAPVVPEQSIPVPNPTGAIKKLAKLDRNSSVAWKHEQKFVTQRNYRNFTLESPQLIKTYKREDDNAAPSLKHNPASRGNLISPPTIFGFPAEDYSQGSPSMIYFTSKEDSTEAKPSLPEVARQIVQRHKISPIGKLRKTVAASTYKTKSTNVANSSGSLRAGSARSGRGRSVSEPPNKIPVPLATRYTSQRTFTIDEAVNIPNSSSSVKHKQSDAPMHRCNKEEDENDQEPDKKNSKPIASKRSVKEKIDAPKSISAASSKKNQKPKEKVKPWY